jgi:AraC family transcriptional regulator
VDVAERRQGDGNGFSLWANSASGEMKLRREPALVAEDFTSGCFERSACGYSAPRVTPKQPREPISLPTFDALVEEPRGDGPRSREGTLSLRAIVPQIRTRIELGRTEHLRVALLTDPAGLVEAPAYDRVRVCIHAGPPVFACCRHGREQHHGTVIYGDVDIIPAGTPAVWELKGTDIDLVIILSEQLLGEAVLDSGRSPSSLQVLSRFQVRDTQIEHLGWALKAEMGNGYSSGRLYTDSLGRALAVRIVGAHSSFSSSSHNNEHTDGIPQRRLRDVLGFMEENLGQDITLQELAAAGGVCVSHFNALFRKSMGMSAHQYLIRRRVARAAELLRNDNMPIGQVALEVGFCHQSHLAMHMRRILGVSPSRLRPASR